MTPRQRRLHTAIATVLAKFPNAKYTLLCGMWYIKVGDKMLSYGQKTPYEAWTNAAIFTQTMKA